MHSLLLFVDATSLRPSDPPSIPPYTLHMVKQMMAEHKFDVGDLVRMLDPERHRHPSAIHKSESNIGEIQTPGLIRATGRYLIRPLGHPATADLHERYPRDLEVRMRPPHPTPNAALFNLLGYIRITTVPHLASQFEANSPMNMYVRIRT